MNTPIQDLESLADITAQHNPIISHVCRYALAEMAKITDQRNALLAACQMEELLANCRARESWSDQKIQFLRRLSELATVHGWDGNETPPSEFVRDFRRQAIALATKEQP